MSKDMFYSCSLLTKSSFSPQHQQRTAETPNRTVHIPFLNASHAHAHTD